MSGAHWEKEKFYLSYAEKRAEELKGSHLPVRLQAGLWRHIKNELPAGMAR